MTSMDAPVVVEQLHKQIGSFVSQMSRQQLHQDVADKLPELLRASERVAADEDGAEAYKILLAAGTASLGGARPIPDNL